MLRCCDGEHLRYGVFRPHCFVTTGKIYLTHMAHDNWFQYEFIWWYAYFSLKKIIKINYLTSYLSFAEDVFCIFINSNELRYLFVFLLTQMNIFNVLNNLTTYNFPSSLWVSKTNHNSQPHGILGNTKKNMWTKFVWNVF